LWSILSVARSAGDKPNREPILLIVFPMAIMTLNAGDATDPLLGHHHADHDESVAVYSLTPPGENVKPLTGVALLPARQFDQLSSRA
jgi:hypothetical protein